MEEKISIQKEDVLNAYEFMKTTNKYHMSFADAQEYVSKRDFNIPWNDCDVFIDEREITRTVGNVLKWADEHPYWRPSTEHPQMDEEVIALVVEYNAIYFAHIVNKDIAIDYDGWNIPDVKCWIPCPKIKED